MTGSMYCAPARAGLEMVRAFADAPAVVAALDDQDPLPPTNPGRRRRTQSVAGLPVKAVTPRVAQAVGENFLARAAFAAVRFVHKRIVARDAVFADGGGVAKRVVGFASSRQCAAFWRAASAVFWPLLNGSSAGAAVAEAEIQIAVRAEREFAALVVAERLRHLQQNALGCQVGQIRVGGGDLEFADDAADGKVCGWVFWPSGFFWL